jgi:glycosyltransferase involved in cell wall biosynthesis
MSHLIYIANARMPTEKAHGYQIVQMCEALALAGQQVTLVLPQRRNDQPDLQGIHDPWAYYSVRRNFQIRYLPCLDLIWLLDNRPAFWLQTLTFILSLLVWLPWQRYQYLFSRDPFIVAVLSLWQPTRLIYEVHHKLRSRWGIALQRWLVGRVGLVVALTGTLAQQLQSLEATRIISAHDGVRPERFANVPSQAQARTQLSLPPESFIACYAGRLHTMEMGKGLDVLVEAAQWVPDLYFLLVGGPAQHVTALQQQWVKLGLPPDHFIAVGTVPPDHIPPYLAAADVCLITSPQNEFFANETSPMKLFEYMLAGKAIIASDLPSTREVVQHGHSAYLIPPSDPQGLAQALQTLHADPALRQRLGATAHQAALGYTWEARARHILAAMNAVGPLQENDR